MRVMIGGKPAEPLPAHNDAEELVLSETRVADPAPAEPEAWYEAAEDEDAPRRAGWVLPAIAIVAVLGWL
ncbi:MAG TPA: hypothetical protein VN029_07290, partial [Sphingomonas sp.]|nr:hypothetical protein [Sphingomonas sp.]